MYCTKTFPTSPILLFHSIGHLDNGYMTIFIGQKNSKWENVKNILVVYKEFSFRLWHAEGGRIVCYNRRKSNTLNLHPRPKIG